MRAGILVFPLFSGRLHTIFLDGILIEYRSFHNTDPPQLVDLWHACELGRGAADGFSGDAFEYLIFSQPYFEKPGLTVAVTNGRIVGYVHAGFGEPGGGNQTGAICALLVHPEFRRQGIGRELVARAEQWLKQSGAETVSFGASATNTPFYLGMYGGAEPTGFLESDHNAGPFAAALGMKPIERYASFQRNVQTSRDPINMRYIQNRRKYQLKLQVRPLPYSMWWATRVGRLDAISAVLEPKSGGEPVAQAECYMLELYMQKWGSRAVGINEIFVPEELRRQGFGQTLLLELSARMKRELVDIIDVSVPEDNEPATKLIEASSFERVDTGVVYGRTA